MAGIEQNWAKITIVGTFLLPALLSTKKCSPCYEVGWKGGGVVVVLVGDLWLAVGWYLEVFDNLAPRQ